MIRADELTPKNIVAFVFNALRDISDGFTVIQKHFQYLPGLHGLQPQFGFDKIVGTDDATEVQHCLGINFLTHRLWFFFHGINAMNGS